MGLIEDIYAAAANVGFLKTCVWQPPGGAAAQSHPVGFSAPDDVLLNGLALNCEYQMSWPASVFAGLAQRDSVLIDGVRYQVREIRAVGDGSQLRASLTRL